MRKAFKYFTLKLSIEDKQTRDVCEEILGMREELMYIQRILDFNIMDKVMCFMPFTFEQMEGKLSSEKAKVRTIVENLELISMVQWNISKLIVPNETDNWLPLKCQYTVVV